MQEIGKGTAILCLKTVIISSYGLIIYLCLIFSNERRIRVLLPRDYFKMSVIIRFYICTMGKMFLQSRSVCRLFVEGHSLIKQHLELPQMIIVGIDNSAEHRLDEYSPWKTEFQTSDGTGYFGGLGRAYVDWLVDTVKPFIDKKISYLAST